SVFGKLVASGWHTTSVTMKLLVESGVMQATGILGLGVDDLSWPQPVLPGDVLRVRWEVVERSPSRSGNRGLIRTLVTTLNQRDEVVMTMRPKLLVPAQSVG
ncbi:MAG: dehydratase, partial [Candidatus Eremiobacteraeota bacterium]|nr:dehydratase [Candidatus Eremiobacteraeota bacterium]